MSRSITPRIAALLAAATTMVASGPAWACSCLSGAHNFLFPGDPLSTVGADAWVWLGDARFQPERAGPASLFDAGGAEVPNDARLIRTAMGKVRVLAPRAPLTAGTYVVRTGWEGENELLRFTVGEPTSTTPNAQIEMSFSEDEGLSSCDEWAWHTINATSTGPWLRVLVQDDAPVDVGSSLFDAAPEHLLDITSTGSLGYGYTLCGRNAPEGLLRATSVRVLLAHATGRVVWRSEPITLTPEAAAADTGCSTTGIAGAPLALILLLARRRRA